MALDVLGRTALAVGSMASLFVLLHLWMDPSSLTLGATSHGQFSVNTCLAETSPYLPRQRRCWRTGRASLHAMILVSVL